MTNQSALWGQEQMKIDVEAATIKHMKFKNENNNIT